MAIGLRGGRAQSEGEGESPQSALACEAPASGPFGALAWLAAQAVPQAAARGAPRRAAAATPHAFRAKGWPARGRDGRSAVGAGRRETEHKGGVCVIESVLSGHARVA